MHPRKRRPLPPWQRGTPDPRHPIGRARRRWPRAYDGAGDPAGGVNRRYRRSFDGGERRSRVSNGIRRVRRSSTLDRIRRNPVRHGLIGLTIAGAAVPIAMSRQDTQLRTDPTHEQVAARAAVPRLSDELVASAWRAAEEESAEARKEAIRETKIEENLERHADYDVPRDLAESIYDIALENDLDPDVAFGLVRAESSFRNSATSHVGAVGLTQLMPRTAAWLEPGTSTSDLRDPDTNLRIGFRYLRDLIDKYDGNTEMALFAYNRGPGTVDRILKRGGNPDNGYADMVLRGGAH